MKGRTRAAVLVAGSSVLILLPGCATRHLRAPAPRAHDASSTGRTMSGAPRSSSVPSMSVSRPPADEPGPCKDGTLALSYDPAMIFQATGDRGDAFRIVNRGPRTCSLIGYPKVTLRDHLGRLVPFQYTDGQSQYVTGRRPQPVLLTPGSRAYVAVAKYRCDLGNQAPATMMTMRLPGQRKTLSVPLTGRALNFAYCRGGPHDPGNTVAISPIEAAADRTQY